MKKNILLLSLIVLFLVGCDSDVDSSFEIETNGIDLLLQNYDLKIAEEPHLYILIPFFSCSGCNQQSLINLDNLLSPLDSNSITFIYQSEEVVLSDFENKALVIFDNDNIMDEMPFIIANLTVFKTENGKVVEKITTNSENVVEVINKDLIQHIK